MRKNSFRLSLAPRGSPPVLYRGLSFGAYHFLIVLVLVTTIVVTEDFETGGFAPFVKIADFALMLQVVHACLFLSWAFVGYWGAYRLARRASRAGGAVCIHCGYIMDQNLSQGVCPECGGVYSRDEAVRSWSVMRV